MKINYLIVTIIAIFLFQQGMTQTIGNKGNVKAAKIRFKPVNIQQDSALATYPILVSVAEENNFKSPVVHESMEKYTVNFYPEPENGIIYIQFDNLDKSIKPELFFYNEKGDILYEIKTITRLNVINLREVPSGTYLITADVNKEISTWEIVKE